MAGLDVTGGEGDTSGGLDATAQDVHGKPDAGEPADVWADAGGGDALDDTGGEDALVDAGGEDALADAEDALADAEDTLEDIGGEDAVEDIGADMQTDTGADAQADTGADVGDPPPVCDLGDLGDDDKPRVVLISQPFTTKPSIPGTDIRSMTLEAGGLPVDDGMILDVGVRVGRMAFVPSGAYALVVGDDGDVISVAVKSATDMHIVDSVKLPSADYGDIAISQDGTVAWIVGLNVNETSGVSVVHIDCAGKLTVEGSGFLNIRLAESIAVLPGEQTAVLLGGQTVFDPKDPSDIRLLGRVGDAWTEVGSFDIFQDFVNTGRIAASPDGTRVLVPNSSAFSFEEGDVSILAIGDEVLTEEDRITTLSAVSEALFSTDGLTALISRPEVNRVAILSDLGTGLSVTGEIKGVGLADQMVLIERGTNEGLVLIPSVDSNGGPNLAVLRIEDVGLVTDLGQIELGSGSLNIPDAIAVMR